MNYQLKKMALYEEMKKRVYLGEEPCAHDQQTPDQKRVRNGNCFHLLL